MQIAERSQGKFSRQLLLGESLDTDRIVAGYAHRRAGVCSRSSAPFTSVASTSIRAWSASATSRTATIEMSQ